MTTQPGLTRTALSCFAYSCAVLAWIVFAPVAIAFPNYHDPAFSGFGFCASCHPRFPGRAETHDLHVTPFTTQCNLCHTGDTRNNPFTLWSVGTGDGSSNFACAGCHGRDYGETIQLANGWSNGTSTWNLNGLPKSSGYGLRKQHLIKGVTDCIACHADVPRSVILPENVPPPYYARSDTNVANPCLGDLVLGGEDSSPEYSPVVGSPGSDVPDEDSVGLDNDGDGRIDQADPDCNAALITTPGEAGAPGGASPLRASLAASGDITLSFGPACSSTNHSIYVGPLTPADLQTGNYTQAFCQADPGMTGEVTFDPGLGDVFILVVGEDATNSGSFGESYSRDLSNPDPNLVNYPIQRERPGSGQCNRPAPADPAATRCD